MEHIERKFLQEFPQWNEEIIFDEEIHLYCKKRRLVVRDTDLIDDLGEYRIRNDRPIILINKFVSDRYRPWVFTHEIGHDLCHSPLNCKFTTGTKQKVEKEANIFAAIALMPRWLIETKTIWEIEDEFGYPRKLILLRIWIRDNYRI